MKPQKAPPPIIPKVCPPTLKKAANAMKTKVVTLHCRSDFVKNHLPIGSLLSPLSSCQVDDTLLAEHEDNPETIARFLEVSFAYTGFQAHRLFSLYITGGLFYRNLGR